MTDHAEKVRNYYREQGADAERARIIALLESYGLHSAVFAIKGDNE
jgi:hypothetical protein